MHELLQTEQSTARRDALSSSSGQAGALGAGAPVGTFGTRGRLTADQVSRRSPLRSRPIAELEPLDS